MSLEVRQLVLKASVADDAEEAESGTRGKAAEGASPSVDAEQLKQEILAACRQWFQEALRQQRER